MFNVALISRWHPHSGRYSPELKAMPGVNISCVWDADVARGQAWAKELGVAFEPDYKKLLARKDVDGICVTAETSMHKELIVAAAEAGKHVFSEKCLAITTADAEKIREAVKKSGIKFCIAYIRRTTPAFILGKKLVDAGVLGDITMMRVRNGHNQALTGLLPNYWFDPKTTGGGAMMDLGCHPMYLLDWILGDVEELSATYSFYTGKEVEDSGAATILYKNKALGVAESTFTGFAVPYMFEIYGTQGSYLCKFDNPTATIDLRVNVDNSKATEALLPAKAMAKKDIIGNAAAYVIDVKGLPEAQQQLEQWVDGCTKGTPIPFDIDSAVRLTRIMEACNTSYREGRTVKL